MYVENVNLVQIERSERPLRVELRRNQTFTATVPEVDTGREMTERLARWVGRQALEYTYASTR